MFHVYTNKKQEILEDDPYRQGNLTAPFEQTETNYDDSVNQPDPTGTGRTDKDAAVTSVADVAVRKSMIVTLKMRPVVDKNRKIDRKIDGSTRDRRRRAKKKKSSTAKPVSQPPKKSYQGNQMHPTMTNTFRPCHIY